MHETATVFDPLFKIAWTKSIFYGLGLFGQDVTRRDKTVFISSIFFVLFLSLDLMHDAQIEISIFLVFKILRELIHLSVSQSI